MAQLAPERDPPHHRLSSTTMNIDDTRAKHRVCLLGGDGVRVRPANSHRKPHQRWSPARRIILCHGWGLNLH